MCGHGTIGLVGTLAHLVRNPARQPQDRDARGQSSTPRCMRMARFPCERPELSQGEGRHGGGSRHRQDHRRCRVGGNWFFLVSEQGRELTLANVEPLTTLLAHRAGGERTGPSRGGPRRVFGRRRPAVIHGISCCAPARPYDRSPCGTGKSAKLPASPRWQTRRRQPWLQRSILGHAVHRQIPLAGPGARAKSHPSSPARRTSTPSPLCLLDDTDPFGWGIRS